MIDLAIETIDNQNSKIERQHQTRAQGTAQVSLNVNGRTAEYVWEDDTFIRREQSD